MADVTFGRRGAAAWVTFDRPEAHNAMTFAMYDRLVEHCEAVDADDESGSMVLRGAGGQARSWPAPTSASSPTSSPPRTG